MRNVIEKKTSQVLNVRFPSKFVLIRTVYVSLIAASLSISISTGIRALIGIHSDAVTIAVRLILPFAIAVPLCVYWFSRLEKLEFSYRTAVQHANDLAKVAYKDPLTNLLNRRSFISQFESATNTGIRGWFLLADIDYLKHINDHYGHLAGDDAVLSVAEALEATLPKDSLIGRIGGDEFSAFIPKASCPDITNFIGHINSIAKDKLAARHPEIKGALTISVGFIPCRPKQKFKDIVALADVSLYRKKRNR